MPSLDTPDHYGICEDIAEVVHTGCQADVLQPRAQVLKRNQHFLTSQPDAEAAMNSIRSDEHTSELQSLMRTSYPVFCLKNKTFNIMPIIPTYQYQLRRQHQ